MAQAEVKEAGIELQRLYLQVEEALQNKYIKLYEELYKFEVAALDDSPYSLPSAATFEHFLEKRKLAGKLPFKSYSLCSVKFSVGFWKGLKVHYSRFNEIRQDNRRARIWHLYFNLWAENSFGLEHHDYAQMRLDTGAILRTLNLFASVDISPENPNCCFLWKGTSYEDRPKLNFNCDM